MSFCLTVAFAKPTTRIGIVAPLYAIGNSSPRARYSLATPALTIFERFTYCSSSKACDKSGSNRSRHFISTESVQSPAITVIVTGVSLSATPVISYLPLTLRIGLTEIMSGLLDTHENVQPSHGGVISTSISAEKPGRTDFRLSLLVIVIEDTGAPCWPILILLIWEAKSTGLISSLDPSRARIVVAISVRIDLVTKTLSSLITSPPRQRPNRCRRKLLILLQSRHRRFCWKCLKWRLCH